MKSDTREFVTLLDMISQKIAFPVLVRKVLKVVFFKEHSFFVLLSSMQFWVFFISLLRGFLLVSTFSFEGDKHAKVGKCKCGDFRSVSLRSR